MEKYGFYSWVTNKPYKTVEELKEAEDIVLQEEKEKEEKKQERARRAKEIEEAKEEVKRAQEKLNELISKFLEDYGSYHTTLHSIDDIIDSMFRFF